MEILVLNDDGYKSAGIRALIKEFKPGNKLCAVAPESQQSWKGKSISGHSLLKMTSINYHEFEGYYVNGTPADCAQLGMFELFGSGRPDYVVSGVNEGANIGHAHVLSSGTVGAALEAALQGVPAFASSLWGLRVSTPILDSEAPETVKYYEISAKITRKIVDKVMLAGFPEGVQVVCINVPWGVDENAEIVITKPHGVVYGRLFEPEGEGYRNTAYGELGESDDYATDLHVLSQGKVSVLPISIELYSRQGQEELSRILDAKIAGD